MWFSLPERTLYPRKNRVVLLKSDLIRVSLFLTRCLPGPFIAQGWAVTLRLRARHVASRWLKDYTTFRILMVRNSY
jgi:hypothetical protein